MYPGSKISFRNIKDGTTNTVVACETIEMTLGAWFEGTTAAVWGLMPMTSGGEVKFKSPGTIKEEGDKMRFGCPSPGTPNSMNYGKDGENPQYFCENGPGGNRWLHGPSSAHPAIINHLFADGTVRSLSDSLSPYVYMHLITRAGGEPAPTEVFNRN